MGFNNEYKKLCTIIKKIDKKEKEKNRLKKIYEERYNILKQTPNGDKKVLYLASEWLEVENLLNTEIKNLVTERNNAFIKPLFVRIGSLRRELADYLGIDVNEVLLSLRLITYNSPVNHTIDEEDKEYKKYLSEKAILNICVSPPYPKNLKNPDYDIKDSFVYKLDYNMPQADGISLIDHMYKEVENPNSSEKMYKEVKLMDDEVEELYLKVPFQLLFHKETDNEFHEGQIELNPDANCLSENEKYSYEIYEYRKKEEKLEGTINAFRTCVMNCLKKEDVKNKTLTK